MALPYPSLSMPSTGSFVANSPYAAGQAYYGAYGGGQAAAYGQPEGYYGYGQQQQQQGYGAPADYLTQEQQYQQYYQQQQQQYQQQLQQYQQGTYPSYGAGAAAPSGYGVEAPPLLPSTGSFVANSGAALTGTYGSLLLDPNAPLGGSQYPLGTAATLDPYAGYSARQQPQQSMNTQQSFAYTPQMAPGYQFKFYANYSPDEKAHEENSNSRSIFVPTPAPKMSPNGSADKENRIPERPSSEKGPLVHKPAGVPKAMPKRVPKAAAKKKKGMCGC